MLSTRSLALIAVLAVVIPAVVVYSAATMVSCGTDGAGGQPAAVGEPPDHYEFVFGSYADGNTFDATVTVSKDGETLLARELSSDGNGSYSQLGTIERPGPYEVTVNSTIPAAGGGNRSEQFTVDGSLGNATAIRVTYFGIYHSSFQLPRHPLEHPVGASTHAISGDDDLPMDVSVEVWYRGERVSAGSAELGSEGVERVVPLNETGIYRVVVRAPEETATKAVVVPAADEHIKVTLDADGRIEEIVVQPAWDW